MAGTGGMLTWLTPARAVALAALLLAVIFLALNVFAQHGMRSMRLDLTANRLFTLSEGTRSILAGLDEPVRLRFFYSERLGTGYPQIHGHATRVRDLLEEMAAIAGEELILEVIDPEPFTDAEDEAVAYGLQGAGAQGETIYFGLVGTNMVDGREVIPFFAQAREPFLEYDVTSLIAKLAAKSRPKLGIIAGIPLRGTPPNPMMPGSGGGPLLITDQLSERFELTFLDQSLEAGVPSDITTLALVHPRGFSDRELYAIDQFVMKGGRLLVFIDPNSEFASGGAFNEPSGLAPLSSNLPKLLNAYGLAMEEGKVVADRALAHQVSTGGDPRRPSASYLVWLRMDPGQMDRKDVVTGSLEREINFATAGALVKLDGKGTVFTPLVTTTLDSALIDAERTRFSPQPDEIARGFAPQGGPFVLAARLTGEAKSAFPDGPPKEESENAETGAETEAKDEAAPAPAPHLAAATGPINVAVVADSDLFDDRFWVNEQSFLGRRIAVPIAANADFVLGLVENMMGTGELISLRARAGAARPFTVVEGLRRRAEARYLAEEERLSAEIEDTEKRLADLQGESGATGEGGAVLTAAQAEEIARFRLELAASRRALRDVQRSLVADIEALGATLKFINVALMPLFVAGLALALALMRARRRAARAKAG